MLLFGDWYPAWDANVPTSWVMLVTGLTSCTCSTATQTLTSIDQFDQREKTLQILYKQL